MNIVCVQEGRYKFHDDNLLNSQPQNDKQLGTYLPNEKSKVISKAATFLQNRDTDEIKSIKIDIFKFI